MVFWRRRLPKRTLSTVFEDLASGVFYLISQQILLDKAGQTVGLYRWSHRIGLAF